MLWVRIVLRVHKIDFQKQHFKSSTFLNKCIIITNYYHTNYYYSNPCYIQMCIHKLIVDWVYNN